MYAHGQSLRAFNEYVRIIGLVPGDRYLIVNPFFQFVWLQSRLADLPARWCHHPCPRQCSTLTMFFRRVEQDKVTILPGPPTLYLSMLDHPRRGATDLSSLRVAVTGASTIPPVLIKRMREELGFTVVTTAYGLTECGGLATICDPQDSAQTIAGTSGKPIPGTELGILDAKGNALSQGEQGEICLRGFPRHAGVLQQRSGYRRSA